MCIAARRRGRRGVGQQATNPAQGFPSVISPIFGVLLLGKHICCPCSPQTALVRKTGESPDKITQCKFLKY